MFFDFEDLPEDPPEGASRQPPLALGEVLPRIPRGCRVPGWTVLPQNLKKRRDTIQADDATREPRIYLLAFPGASDTVMNGWLNLELGAPPYLEVATYEWPGHVHRKEEASLGSLEALCDDAWEALREPMATGSFMVCGHSIGAALMVLLCERAERELGVQPLASLVLDRGAPHLPVYSERGLDLLVSDPERFTQIYVPSIYEGRNRPGSTFYQTFVVDQQLSNDLRPEGWYKFPCSVHVFAAAHQGFPEWPPPGLDPGSEWVASYEELLRPGRCKNPFSHEEFEAWGAWTASTCEVHRLDCSHDEVKLVLFDVCYKEAERLLRGSAAASCLEALEASPGPWPR